MADEDDTPRDEAAELDDAAGDPNLNSGATNAGPQLSSVSWSQVWQLPVLILAMAMLGLGVWSALPSKESNDFPAAFDSAEQFIAAQNFEEAQKLLDDVHTNLMATKEEERARYNLLQGDLIFLEQRSKGGDVIENHESILRLYGKARELGMTIDGAHQRRWAQTLVALGKYDLAMKKLDVLATEPPEVRYELIRQVIEHRRMMDHTKPEDLRGLIVRYQEMAREETDPQKRRLADLWAVGLTSQLMTESGAPEQAIEYLQRMILRLRDTGSANDVAPLLVNLGKAYQQVGSLGEARRWLDEAQKSIEKTNPLNAEILVGLGNIDMADAGDIQSALGRFSTAATLYPSTPSYFDAMVGRADCEARLGAHAEAIEHFGEAVTLLTGDRKLKQSRGDWLTSIVRSHFDVNIDDDQFDRALDYLTLLRPIYPGGLPPRLLADFAGTHELIAQDRRAAGTANEDQARDDDTAAAAQRLAARRLANQEAAQHFEIAGDYYFQYAQAVTVTDDEAHGMSLWKAAVCYDSAQRWQQAIQAYSQFVNSRESDPRQLEAINRLGMAYLADGQAEVAAAKFRELIERHPRSAAALSSHVPLARAYIILNETDLAQRLLETVINDHPAITPEAAQYRDALIELGRLHYNRQAFEESIPTLDMAVKRYADTLEGPSLKFRLADSYRQSVRAIDESLVRAMAQSAKLALQQKRVENLELAQKLFGEVVTSFEARSDETMSELERLFLRNAYFYRADCAFDLGRFREAIPLYDMAAKRYENHPASLVALIQQVNAHSELGEFQAARVANDRARWQLRRIPDEAFDDPSLPMSRTAWEDWLKWTSELNLFDAQANAAEAAGSISP